MSIERRFSAVTIAAAAILLIGGCSAPSAFTPGGAQPQTPVAAEPITPTGPQLGQPFEVKQNDGTAKITIVSATYGDSLGGGAFDSPADNGGYLILDVLWETSEGVSSSNFFYFSVKDAEGREGDLSIFVNDPLGAGDVPAGDKSRGNVAFDIGAGPYTVIVTNQMLQEDKRLTIEATPR
ncbi:MAG: hypothetical protein ABIR17_03310 [Pseudolysinimonas sp.]|uniref:hypothetical protein n=1 Tax=Pseudolysinimonas sp. TaxID=2680009 RepID=UPI003267C0ED